MASAATPSGSSVSTAPHPGYLPGLDGMRAVAALAVFGFHAMWRTPALKPLKPVLGHGDIGVEIFFLMSGFLVARPLVRYAVAGGKRVRVGDFWAKRFARIWPAYLVALVGALIVGVGTIDNGSGLAKHLLLTQSLFEDRDGTGLRVSWTLVVEVSFYVIVLPLGLLVATTRRRAHDAWVTLCVALLTFGAWAVWVVSYGETVIPLRVLPPFLPAFAMGMLLAGAEVDTRPGTWAVPVLEAVRRLAARPVLCFSLAAGLFVGMALLLSVNVTAPAFDFGGQRVAQSYLQVIIAFLALAPLALRTTSAGWLEHRVLVAIGVASFGFYLWHIQVLRLVRPMLQGSAWTAVPGLLIAVAGAYLAGEASRRYIEDPARRLLVRGGK